MFAAWKLRGSVLCGMHTIVASAYEGRRAQDDDDDAGEEHARVEEGMHAAGDVGEWAALDGRAAGSAAAATARDGIPAVNPPTGSLHISPLPLHQIFIAMHVSLLCDASKMSLSNLSCACAYQVYSLIAGAQSVLCVV